MPIADQHVAGDAPAGKLTATAVQSDGPMIGHCFVPNSGPSDLQFHQDSFDRCEQ